MDGRMKKAAVTGLVCLTLIIISYLGLAVYYSGGFSLNTWINGVYCTGRTVEDVNAQLIERTRVPDHILVVGLDTTGEKPVEKGWEISLQELGLTADYTDSLNLYLAAQNPWMWIENIISHDTRTIAPVFSYEREGLLAQWKEIISAADREEAYRIVYEADTGYSLYNGLDNRLDEKKAYEVFLKAAASGEAKVNLMEQGCYYDMPLNAKQEETARLWKRIEAFQENAPVYEMGNGNLQVDAASMAAFLKKEERGERLPILDSDSCLQLAEQSVEQFVENLAERYNTYGGVWKFQSTRGDIVEVTGGTYGNTIDQKKETEWLSAYLLDVCRGNISGGVTHAPAYERDTFHPGGVIGDTYVEVDMGRQKLYYYKAGRRMLETDVVTGNLRWRMDTPEGVNFVFDKAKNVTLRGTGYTSFVKYWMAVNGGIGIHDASWRGEFGGEIYKTNGSHGCINVQKDVMADIYDMVELGTPVVMFYGEEKPEN